MSKIILIFFAANVLVGSAPVNEDAQALILKYDFSNDGSGNYKFSYETSNGLTREETGEVVNAGKEDEHIVVRGVYSYIDADGIIQNVSYTADENGYQQLVARDYNNIKLPLLEPVVVRVSPAIVSSLLG